MSGERERYLAMLPTGPLLRADAIVVLCGEDAGPRLDVAVELFRSGAAPRVLLSGGVDDPPRKMGAERAHGVLMGKGVSPGAIIVENESQHTAEQARTVVACALESQWARLLVVASPYHQHRAHLTFVAALKRARATRKVHVLMVAASQCPWWGRPEGVKSSRAALLVEELGKIDTYGADVASYAQGLAYLRHWESHDPA